MIFPMVATGYQVGGACDSVVVRAGTLKGGGPGDSTNSEVGSCCGS